MKPTKPTNALRHASLWWCRGARYGRTSDLGKSCSHLLSLGAAFPESLEASAELAAAQGDDGVGALDGPVHACPLEPRPNYDFATRLHDAGRSTEALFFELGIPHAPSISPHVLNTFSRLFVLTDVAAQRVHQGFQVTFVKLLDNVHRSMPCSRSGLHK